MEVKSLFKKNVYNNTLERIEQLSSSSKHFGIERVYYFNFSLFT